MPARPPVKPPSAPRSTPCQRGTTDASQGAPKSAPREERQGDGGEGNWGKKAESMGEETERFFAAPKVPFTVPPHPAPTMPFSTLAWPVPTVSFPAHSYCGEAAGLALFFFSPFFNILRLWGRRMCVVELSPCRVVSAPLCFLSLCCAVPLSFLPLVECLLLVRACSSSAACRISPFVEERRLVCAPSPCDPSVRGLRLIDPGTLAFPAQTGARRTAPEPKEPRGPSASDASEQRVSMLPVALNVASPRDESDVCACFARLLAYKNNQLARP